MPKNIYPGKFIVIEGLDGSGQSTQVKLLSEFLIKNGHNVVSTKEPTKDSEAGKNIRDVINKSCEVSPSKLQELFAEDRKEHLANVIVPALKDGKTVISDRYFFSSFAYGAASGADMEDLIGLNQDFLMPDFTVILRVKPEVCMERIGKRGESQTLFEQREKLAKVWKIYEILPQRFDGVYIIDGERTIEKVQENIKELLQENLWTGR